MYTVMPGVDYTVFVHDFIMADFCIVFSYYHGNPEVIARIIQTGNRETGYAMCVHCSNREPGHKTRDMNKTSIYSDC